MRINIENVNKFFKENGKKWVCTTITALMLSAPAIAKVENNTGDNNSKQIEQSCSINLNEEKNIIDVTDLITDDVDESITNIKEKMTKVLQDENSITLKCYGQWKDNGFGKYARSVMTIKPNYQYFENHTYEQFLDDLQNGNTDGIMEFISSSIEVSNSKPKDYNFISCEIVETNTIIRTSCNKSGEMFLLILLLLAGACFMALPGIAYIMCHK